MGATVKGGLANVDQLLGAGADADREDLWGRTCIVEAARSGYPAIASRPLEAGADVHREDSRRQTCLLAATTRYGNLAAMNRSLEAGADANYKNCAGRTCNTDATQRGRPNIASRYLGERAVVYREDHVGQTCLFAAATKRYENLSVVDRLLDAGEDVDIALLNAGADVHHEDHV